MSEHIVNQIRNPAPISDDTLHVIGVVSNPVRYHSRYRLARDWMAHMEATPHVKLTMVEAAFGDRHHEVTEGRPEHIRLRTKSEIWCKESMINIGIRSVIGRYPTAKYFAWIDADIEFHDPNWALETIHQLQHFDVVQPWSDCTLS